jgi:hypothetical protein
MGRTQPRCAVALMVPFSLMAQVGLLLLFENGWAAAQTESAPGATRNKHQYCVVTQKADRVVCQDCSAQLGGEGGKVICRYRFSTGTVRYGRCDEPRNRPPC